VGGLQGSDAGVAVGEDDGLGGLALGDGGGRGGGSCRRVLEVDDLSAEGFWGRELVLRSGSCHDGHGEEGEDGKSSELHFE